MTVSAQDRGLQLGDGLFETLLWTGDRLDRFEAHAARMIRGCKVLGLPAPIPADMQAAALKAISEQGLDSLRAAIRLTWTAGVGGRGLDRPDIPAPVLLVTAAAAPLKAASVRLATVTTRRNEGSPASRVKSLAYLDNILARREAVAAGADEALMLNNQSQIACAAAANLFWFEGDILVTPALACGVLDGVIRSAVLASAEALGLRVRQVTALREDLNGASGLFVTNSLIGVRTVSSLDDRLTPSHPCVETLAQKIA